MSIVICKLPKAGLGNQLFPLMNAFVFAKINKLQVIVTGYHQVKIGPYLRKEKTKRSYNGYFNFQKNIIAEYGARIKVRLLKKRYTCVFEPEIQLLQKDDILEKAFIFENMPTYHDYFVHLKDYRQEVKELLYEMLTPSIHKSINENVVPVIGVHIRMGDFRKLQEGEIFNGGHVRMPEDYFINIIKGIRKINGKELAVSVFTDGYKEEFKQLFNLGNIQIIEGNADITDLVLLSKSKIIVSSTGSTFSAWAGFLSDSPYLIHPNHVHKSLRPEKYGEQVYEGAFDESNKILIKQIKEIKHRKQSNDSIENKGDRWI